MTWRYYYISFSHQTQTVLNNKVAPITNLQGRENTKSKYEALQVNPRIVVNQKEIRKLFQKRKSKGLQNKNDRKKQREDKRNDIMQLNIVEGIMDTLQKSKIRRLTTNL